MLGKEELSNRDVWQDKSGEKSVLSENNFYDVFQQQFAESDFVIRKNPNELKNIYVDVSLEVAEQEEIYNPKESIKQHGITPDFAIDNKATKKTIYVEIKRQDGWVEGKSRSAGRENAHERSCKYFTPGLVKILRMYAGVKEPHLPFWLVLQGDITRDPCRVREITLWFDSYKANYFFWRDIKESKKLLDHFDRHIKHIIS